MDFVVRKVSPTCYRVMNIQWPLCDDSKVACRYFRPTRGWVVAIRTSRKKLMKAPMKARQSSSSSRIRFDARRRVLIVLCTRIDPAAPGRKKDTKFAARARLRLNFERRLMP